MKIDPCLSKTLTQPGEKLETAKVHDSTAASIQTGGCHDHGKKYVNEISKSIENVTKLNSILILKPKKHDHNHGHSHGHTSLVSKVGSIKSSAKQSTKKLNVTRIESKKVVLKVKKRQGGDVTSDEENHCCSHGSEDQISESQEENTDDPEENDPILEKLNDTDLLVIENLFTTKKSVMAYNKHYKTEYCNFLQD